MREYDKLLESGNRAQLEKLYQNRHKNGFDTIMIIDATRRIKEELEELEEVACNHEKRDYPNFSNIRHEAADIANFAHMIIYKCDRELNNQTPAVPFKVGDKVTYIPKIEKGIIKSLSGDDHAFVVYNCAGEWDNYQDYTGARTELSDLKAGWETEEKHSEERWYFEVGVIVEYNGKPYYIKKTSTGKPYIEAGGDNNQLFLEEISPELLKLRGPSFDGMPEWADLIDFGEYLGTFTGFDSHREVDKIMDFYLHMMPKEWIGKMFEITDELRELLN